MRMLNPNNNTKMLWPRQSLTSELMNDFFSDFDRMANSLLRPTAAMSNNFVPSCDIHETKDHFLVCFDMPGVNKNNVNVEIEGNQLTVAGERFRETKNTDAEGILRSERQSGKFQRTFNLPSTIDAEKIEAHYEDGVLNIAIPKLEKSKGRAIQVQSGKSGFFGKLLGSSKKNEEKEVKTTKAS